MSLQFHLGCESKFTSKDKYLLLLITLMGAFIRIYYQHNRSYIGDEVGTIIWMEKDVLYLLTHFTTWLTMNYFIVLEKFVSMLFGSGPLSLGLVPLISGIASIPLTATLARKFTTPKVAITASLLVAANPYLIMYSGIIRSYSLFTVSSLLSLVLFANYYRDPSSKNGIYVAFACFFMTLFHPNGCYTVAFIFLLLTVMVLKNPKKDWLIKISHTILIPLFIAMLLILMAYMRIFPDMLKDGVRWHAPPPTSMSYIPFLFIDYFSTSFLRWLSVVFAILGIISAYSQKRPLILLSLCLVIPAICMSLQGLSHHSWHYARFFIPYLPILLIFLSEGLSFCSERYTLSKYRFLTLYILLGIVLATWTPNVNPHLLSKIPINTSPWYKAANYILPQYQEGDIILCERWFMQLHLHSYLPKSKYRIEVLREFAKNTDPIALGAKVFLISSGRFQASQASETLRDWTGSGFEKRKVYFQTAQASETLTDYKIIIYTVSSKKDFLKILREDYVKTIESIDNKSDKEVIDAYGHVCSINKFFKVRNDIDCAFWRASKPNEEIFGPKMTSLWKKKNTAPPIETNNKE
ncbi:MAG: hypothetical protein HZB24_10800 [Desulfobacterales bacterium]|nr:hypothetical protein [Desulfobacterales bacterium]